MLTLQLIVSANQQNESWQTNSRVKWNLNLASTINCAMS